MTDAHEQKSFEAGMAELEVLVGRLEGGELPLEEALAVFEAGVALVRQLGDRLNAAEARVEVLSRTTDGRLALTPLAADADREE